MRVDRVSESTHAWIGQTKWQLKTPATTEGWRAAILVRHILGFFCDEHPLNNLQKGCFNEPKHSIFTLAFHWSFLSLHAKFQAARFYSFGWMETTHWHTDTLPLIIPPLQRSGWYIVFALSVRACVRPSVRACVRPNSFQSISPMFFHIL